MNFDEIEKDEENKEQNPEKISLEEIKRHLQINTKMGKMEYQNHLLMESLEQYNQRFEKLKIELNEQQKQQKNEIQELKEIVMNLKNNNETLKEGVKETVEGIQDRIEELYGDEIKKLIVLSKEIKNEIKEESKEYIGEINQSRNQIKNSHTSYFKRKAVIDILIYVALGATPILAGILIYMYLISGK